MRNTVSGLVTFHRFNSGPSSRSSKQANKAVEGSLMIKMQNVDFNLVIGFHSFYRNKPYLTFTPSPLQNK